MNRSWVDQVLTRAHITLGSVVRQRCLEVHERAERKRLVEVLGALRSEYDQLRADAEEVRDEYPTSQWVDRYSIIDRQRSQVVAEYRDVRSLLREFNRHA